MRISILGPLEVQTADGCLEIPGPRLRALLIRLAVDPGRVVSAERLIDDLWQDAMPAAANNALQALVSRLRAVVGRATIEQGGGGYRLNLPPEAVDVVLFEQRVRSGRAALEIGDAVVAANSFRAALDLWRGTALSDVEGMPFAGAEAAGLEEKRVVAVEDLVDALLAQSASAANEAGTLLPELEQLRVAFPLRERLHARHMRVLYALGRQAEALAAYEQLRETLADRLGVDPSPELAGLHLAMLRQAPDLSTLVPIATPVVNASPSASAPSSASQPSGPLPISPPRLGNLPAQLTSFIGRESELELVTGLLRNARLVTLTGPGGAGKTRLAQECGARLGELAVDGVWFAPLAAVADGADVALAVLASLGGENTMSLTEFAMDRLDALTPRERLHALLADRRMILILDNCEHVLDAVAELVDQVLSAAPGVRVLATSREPLALTGETLCPVSSLGLPPEPASDTPVQTKTRTESGSGPEPGAGPGSNSDVAIDAPTFKSVIEYPAVQLFVERAAAVRPGFQLTPANVAPVVRICRALDGIPLAIELAAARLRSLSPQQVADRLDDRFRLLSSGSRTALPRHQTLRAIVDWSWELLTPAERTVLARLAVFAGGATPDAATHVCSADPPAGSMESAALPCASAATAATSSAVLPGASGARITGSAVRSGGSADLSTGPARPADSGDLPAGSDAAPASLQIASIPSDDVIDIIASLVDKSLVVAQEDEAGEVRYRLLETVRAYAADRLEESGERSRIRDIHAAHFVALAERADSELRAVNQIHWITRLTLERENLNAALRQAVATSDVASALRIFQSLLWFWMMRNHEKDVMQWAEEIGALIDRPEVESPGELAEARLLCLGSRRVIETMRENGDFEAATSALLEFIPESAYTAHHPLLAMARPVIGALVARGADGTVARAELDALADHPDPWVRAARYSFTGLIELNRANPSGAEQTLLTGYAKFRELGERQGLIFTLVVLTEFALATGDFHVAISRAEEAYGYANDGLSSDSGSMLLIKVGQARCNAGEIDTGRRLVEQAARTAERCGELADAATGHAELAALAFKQGDRAEARRRLASASDLIASRAGNPDAGPANSAILCRRGYLAVLDHDFDAARDYFRQAVDVVRKGPFLTFMSGFDELLNGIAALAGAQGDHTRAAELLGGAFSVMGLRNMASYSDPPTRAAALAALGEEEFEAAFERGRRLSRSEVLAIEP